MRGKAPSFSSTKVNLCDGRRAQKEEEERENFEMGVTGSTKVPNSLCSQNRKREKLFPFFAAADTVSCLMLRQGALFLLHLPT